MTEYTSRKPDYFSDIETYGKFGEDLFLEDYKNLSIKDVRKSKFYQQVDIDFIVNDKWFVEVKVDTVALKTGNLAFEVISHNSLGWSSITQADFIYIVLAEDKPLKAIKTILINMPTWREYCANRKTIKRINTIQSEGIIDILCPIEELKKHNVIIKEKDNEVHSVW